MQNHSSTKRKRARINIIMDIRNRQLGARNQRSASHCIVRRILVGETSLPVAFLHVFDFERGRGCTQTIYSKRKQIFPNGYRMPTSPSQLLPEPEGARRMPPSIPLAVKYVRRAQQILLHHGSRIMSFREDIPATDYQSVMIALGDTTVTRYSMPAFKVLSSHRVQFDLYQMTNMSLDYHNKWLIVRRNFAWAPHSLDTGVVIFDLYPYRVRCNFFIEKQSVISKPHQKLYGEPLSIDIDGNFLIVQTTNKCILLYDIGEYVAAQQPPREQEVIPNEEQHILLPTQRLLLAIPSMSDNNGRCAISPCPGGFVVLHSERSLYKITPLEDIIDVMRSNDLMHVFLSHTLEELSSLVDLDTDRQLTDTLLHVPSRINSPENVAVQSLKYWTIELKILLQDAARECHMICDDGTPAYVHVLHSLKYWFGMLVQHLHDIPMNRREVEYVKHLLIPDHNAFQCQGSVLKTEWLICNTIFQSWVETVLRYLCNASYRCSMLRPDARTSRNGSSEAGSNGAGNRVVTSGVFEYEHNRLEAHDFDPRDDAYEYSSVGRNDALDKLNDVISLVIRVVNYLKLERGEPPTDQSTRSPFPRNVSSASGPSNENVVISTVRSSTIDRFGIFVSLAVIRLFNVGKSLAWEDESELSVRRNEIMKATFFPGFNGRLLINRADCWIRIFEMGERGITYELNQPYARMIFQQRANWGYQTDEDYIEVHRTQSYGSSHQYNLFFVLASKDETETGGRGGRTVLLYLSIYDIKSLSLLRKIHLGFWLDNPRVEQFKYNIYIEDDILFIQIQGHQKIYVYGLQFGCHLDFPNFERLPVPTPLYPPQ